MKRCDFDLSYDRTEVHTPEIKPRTWNETRHQVIRNSQDKVIFIYLPKKMKPEKQDTKPEYRASLAATPVPCSIGSIEIQLRSEPISPRLFPSTWKIHEYEHRPSVLTSPSMRFRPNRTPLRNQGVAASAQKETLRLSNIESIKLRVHFEVSLRPSRTTHGNSTSSPR